MLQLAYISTSRVEVTAPLLKEILEVSRRRNKSVGITGLLVSGGKRFLQVLEGPDQAVLSTYARIQADDRHRGFVLIACGAITERSFGEWSMAYRYDESAEGDDLETAVTSLAANMSDPNLRAQFVGFSQLHGRAA